MGIDVRAYAQKGLEKEMLEQHSSGINKEEAAEYIQFITDFFLLPYIVGERTEQPFSTRLRSTSFTRRAEPASSPVSGSSSMMRRGS